MAAHRSFIVVQVGLESAAEKELLFWWAELFDGDAPPNYKMDVGGITLECDLDRVSTLHHYLKVPTRILLRLASFRSRDFSVLFKKISSLNWNQWIGAAGVQWNVTASKSRLGQEKRITEVATDALSEYRRRQESPKDGRGSTADVFLRVFQDEFTVSLNLSGEALYKRAQKELVSRAPLRETMAAGLLWHMNDGETDLRVADPLCGTGTFLQEALGLFQRISSRQFAWQELRLFKSVPLRKRHSSSKQFASKVIGEDQHADVCEVARENLSNVMTEPQSIEVLNRELFEASDGKKRDVDWVVSNLPYGRRIKPKGGIEKLYSNVVGAIHEKYDFKKLGLLVARDRRNSLDTKGLKIESEISLSNGGIPVQFVVLERPY